MGQTKMPITFIENKINKNKLINKFKKKLWVFLQVINMNHNVLPC